MVKQRQEKMFLAIIIVGALALAGGLAVFHESEQVRVVEQHTRNNLAAMPQCQVTIGNQPFDLWIARTPSERELGLMWVQPGEMTDNQGMLFIFPTDQAGGFWMRNTLIGLDIAFIRYDGTVVEIEQMEPLSLVSHAPREPYRYAIEVKAGVLGRTGLQIGDIVTIPTDALNR
jgi:uncharacterized membrane protein (UPF0127 family)